MDQIDFEAIDSDDEDLGDLIRKAVFKKTKTKSKSRTFSGTGPVRRIVAKSPRSHDIFRAPPNHS
jgi:hypothetical protein